jgi:predicted dehydrogenase
MEWRMPIRVEGRMLSQFGAAESAGAPRMAVPSEFIGELVFESGVSVGFFCSFLTGYRNSVDVSGTKGHLRVPDFVLPASGTEGALEINGVLANGPGENPAARQDANMIRNFASQVASGRLNEEWPEMALKTQLVVDQCLGATRFRPEAPAL